MWINLIELRIALVIDKLRRAIHHSTRDLEISVRPACSVYNKAPDQGGR